MPAFSDPILLDQVSGILNVSKGRIEQWISRNQFLPALSSTQGKKREWTFGEVFRLTVFVELVDKFGTAPLDAGRLTQIGLYGFQDDGAYFVAYQVEPPIGAPCWAHEIVKASKLGEFLTSGCHVPSLIQTTERGARSIDGSTLPTSGADRAMIIDLDRIERHLKAAWEEI